MTDRQSFGLFSNKMAVKMGLFWVSLILFVIGSNAEGEFTILHSPDSLKFTETNRTLESLLKEIYSASLGLSVEENSEWKGLSIIDPFATPEAAVQVCIDGVSSLGDSGVSKSKRTYPMTVDEYDPVAFEVLKYRISQRFNNGGNKLVNMKLSNVDELTGHPDVFGVIIPPKVPKLTHHYLKSHEKVDQQFLFELEALKAITKKVKAHAIIPDNLVDFFNFRFQSLHPLSDFHGQDSQTTKEAKKLLNEAIADLSDAFVSAYDGSVLVAVVATDVQHTRRVRAVETRADSAEEEPEPVQPTEEDNYSSDYPAIFNIILWFSVVLIFSLIAIVYALMDMDPGRDSIIYRMTSTRMKKDN